MAKYFLSFFVIAAGGLFFLLFQDGSLKKDGGEERGEALDALQFLSAGRSFPNTDIAPEAYGKAFDFLQRIYLSPRKTTSGQWEPIGPQNVGGRTIGIAIDPHDTSIVWLGSAGGGLWRSTTGGLGQNAWSYVNTGFPLLGVSAIAIDPDNSDVMYIGTGETYNYGTSMNGISERTTRGSHGMGILKTTDGGVTWTQSLNWSYQQQRGIWDIVMNPLNPNVVYAATTEGVYRTVDAGASWQNVLPVLMAMDLEIDRVDTNIVYAAVGNLNSTGKGIYKTANSGGSWNLLTNGLPAPTYQGRTIISAYKDNPKILMAMISDMFNTIGVYRSEDEGVSWSMVSNADIANYQGWYAKGLLIKPGDSSKIIAGGIELYRSVNGGTNFTMVSNQSSQGSNYSHPDVHDIIANPLDPEKLYIINDGGLYRSDDFGSSFYSCNDGYVTSQFYIGSVSTTDPGIGLGGLQDNYTYRYTGSNYWDAVTGGDGCYNAIDPNNDQNQFSSAQYLYLFRSTDQGNMFSTAYSHSGPTAFLSPFVMAPSDPAILYAGANHMVKSNDGGFSWGPIGPNPINSSSYILAIGVSSTSSDTVYCGTEPFGNVTMKILRSTDGGNSFTDITGVLPNRYPRDIVVNPYNSKELYAVFSGFGTGHVFRSADAGNSWTDIGTLLPDLPFHCIAINPFDPNMIFAGCDYGVFVSGDKGAAWAFYNAGMPLTAMVFDLVVSPADASLLAFTHGNGVYKTLLSDIPLSLDEVAPSMETFSVFPNPAKDVINVGGETQYVDDITLIDVKGGIVKQVSHPRSNGQKISIDIGPLIPGNYFIRIATEKGAFMKKILVW